MSADLLAILARIGLATSASILLALALRAATRRLFGAEIAYALWALVPFATLSSFLPARRILVESASAPTIDAVVAPMQIIAAAPVLSEVSTAIPLHWDALFIVLWAAGFAISVAFLMAGQRRIAASEDIGPAVVGVLRPRIVVPANFETHYSELERALVIEHERTHIRGGDVQVNALAALAQCALWFNPLIYVARAALRIDQEMACDERVMRKHASARRTYAEAMLKAQFNARPVPLGCAWPPSGAQPLKQRIAMLARPRLGAGRRRLGGALCATALMLAGAGAWSAQPSRIVEADANAAPRSNDAEGAALVEALRQGDARQARALIASGANVNHHTLGDGTPLIEATRLGDVALAELLLASGADVNQPAHGEGNALIVAAAEGNAALVRMFVEAGADVNAVVRADETPLINAARHGRLDAARYLIAHGADVNLAVDAPTLDGMERRSPLNMAQRGGHGDMVRLLRGAGAHD